MTLHHRSSRLPVTQVGTHQDFYVRDFRPKPRDHTANSHRAPGFGSRPQAVPFNQAVLPTIVFLFTSLNPNHEPHWSSSPVCLSNGMSRKPLGRDFTSRIGLWVKAFRVIKVGLIFSGCRKTGFLHYVQLLAEDFDTTT